MNYLLDITVPDTNSECSPCKYTRVLKETDKQMASHEYFYPKQQDFMKCPHEDALNERPFSLPFRG